MIEAFPLHWPIGYSRSKEQIDSRFKVTMDRAQKFLHAEIDRLNATDLIVSSNIPVRKDGMMYSDWMRRIIDDPGVAIYFKYKGKDVAMCCDQYKRVYENIYALGKGIEALRGMDRWGVSDFIDRAFSGFKALPESVSTETWCDVLDLPANATYTQIREAYILKAKTAHPDVGGSAEYFEKVNKAYKQAISLIKE